MACQVWTVSGVLFSGQAEALIRKILLELIGEDIQSQGVEVFPLRNGDEIQDASVYVVVLGIHGKKSIGSRQPPVNERLTRGWSCF